MRTILRYPGGKSRKAKEIISHFSDTTLDLIEPMCGGGGVALEYASMFPGAKIIMSDLNPIVSAFWHYIVDDPKKFCSLLEPMNMDVYKRYRNLQTDDRLFQAMKFFVLNKCSFNGYVFDSAVPVGGWEQKGKWKVDWCWRVAKLESDIMRIHMVLKGRTTVLCDSVFSIINSYRDKEYNWYIDPPYVDAGKKMYGAFGPFDHEKLAEVIKLNLDNFIVSYDRHPSIKKFYAGCEFFTLSVKSSRKLQKAKPGKKKTLKEQGEYLIVKK